MRKMPQDKRSRRRWKIDHSRASGVTNERWKGSSSSSENEAPVPSESKSSSAPIRRKRPISGSSIQRIKVPKKIASEESSSEINVPEITALEEDPSKSDSTAIKKNRSASVTPVKKLERPSKNTSDESGSEIEREVSAFVEPLRRSVTPFRRTRTISEISNKSSKIPDKTASEDSGSAIESEVPNFVQDPPKRGGTPFRRSRTLNEFSSKNRELSDRNVSDKSENEIESDATYVKDPPISSGAPFGRIRTISDSSNRSDRRFRANTSDESAKDAEREITVLGEEATKRSGTPYRRSRTLSESSDRDKGSRRNSQNAIDESGNEIEPEDSEHQDSDSNENNIESPTETARKVGEYPMSDHPRGNERREIVSSDTDFARRDKRRKSRKGRREKHRLVDSNRTEDDDAHDEEGRSSERDLCRPKSKKEREEQSRKSKRRKKTRSRRDSSVKSEKGESELPITEILRQAQENTKTRYEEPVPLTELTTDTIYVQGRNGFSAMKICGDSGAGFLGRRKSSFQEPMLYPIKVAILAQKVWNGTGLIHQGLLAGMALMHFILIQTFFNLSLDVLVKYSLISEIYTNIFSFLVTMCVISAFDKFDVAHVSLEHLREVYIDHSRSLMAIPLYIATFCLHQSSLLVDDRISLLRHAENATEYEDNSIIVEEDLVTWQRVTLAKDGLAVLAWLFVALGPREDMLLTHLKSMEKYADVANISK